MVNESLVKFIHIYNPGIFHIYLKNKTKQKHLFEEIYVELSDYGTTWQEVFVGGRFQLSTNVIIPFICTEYTWSHMIV